ncbi:MAG: siderophore biosynthesis protein [Streptosporangiaceae bacterium]
MRLCLIASKPTDAVTYGFLPAAERLGLEVFLLTDRPEAHVGALAQAAAMTAAWPAGTGPAGERALTGPAPGIAQQGLAGQLPGIVPCDVHDTRALIGRIAGLPAMDAVFTNSDHLQMQAALAADYFGRPGKDWRSALRAKNKPLMRHRLALTGTEKVAMAEITADGEWPPPGLPYPVVLKPAEGVASEDVALAQTPRELAQRCAEYFGRHPGGRLLAEEYLPGTLRTLETLGDGDRLWVFGGFRTTLSPLPYFIEERLTWEPLPPGGELDHVRRALEDLGTSFGPCHTEFSCDGSGGARLIEVNDRLIGDHDEFLLDGLLDDDLFERVLRVHLGERLPAGPPPVRAGHAVADSVLAERSGLLRSAPPGGPLPGAAPGVRLGYWPVRQPGERVGVTHSNRDYLGIITATGPDRELVERSVSAARIMNRWEVAA